MEAKSNATNKCKVLPFIPTMAYKILVCYTIILQGVLFSTHKKIDVTTRSFITKSNKTGQLVTKRTPYEDYDCNNKNTFIISSTISKAQYNLNILTTWITILQTSLLNNPTKTSTCQFENFHKILPIAHYKWKL